MTLDTIVIMLLIATTIVIIITEMIFYLRDKTLNEIREDVYRLFLYAEHDPRFTDAPKERMVWVLRQARIMLPGWAQLLIPESFLEKVVEGWFRAIKDLLDDGKLNKSIKD